MGDYGDFAVAAAVFDNKPLDLTRDGFAFIICIVRRVERYALGRIVEFIGKLRAAEGSLFEKAELSVLEADGFIKSDGSEDFYALLLCETLQSAVCLRGCGKYSVLRLRERVERERNHKLLTVEHQVLDEFHLLCGKAAESVDKHRIAAENPGVRAKQLVYPVNIVKRINVRR